MQIGKLRHRVSLQEEQRVDDGSGGSTTSFVETGLLWANVTGIGGREFYEAKRLNPEISHQVEIRYRPGIVGGMRFMHGDAAFRIVSPVDPDGRGRSLLIMCTELVQ